MNVPIKLFGKHIIRVVKYKFIFALESPIQNQPNVLQKPIYPNFIVSINWWGRSLARYDDGLQKAFRYYGFADQSWDEEFLERLGKPVGRRFKSGRPHHKQHILHEQYSLSNEPHKIKPGE